MNNSKYFSNLLKNVKDFTTKGLRAYFHYAELDLKYLDLKGVCGNEFNSKAYKLRKILIVYNYLLCTIIKMVK